MSRKNIAIESARLANFLDLNQLVQANAVCSKMEALVRDELEAIKDDPKIELQLERHPMWRPYRELHKIRQYILSGLTEKAIETTKSTIKLMSQQ